MRAARQASGSPACAAGATGRAGCRRAGAAAPRRDSPQVLAPFPGEFGGKGTALAAPHLQRRPWPRTCAAPAHSARPQSPTARARATPSRGKAASASRRRASCCRDFTAKWAAKLGGRAASVGDAALAAGSAPAVATVVVTALAPALQLSGATGVHGSSSSFLHISERRGMLGRLGLVASRCSEA